ncbi:unnamed protein product [Rotaria sordida]|uniref:LETM1-like C-terminal domain-containing protein n=1 Tax=Rotaria sordida TaxID=392033 RepID=A0A814KQW5_9BILA|nr:unnamed protein product [Rotaria sordida]CAF3876262.1 unnamed protein product [Rotaria sordida]
MCTDGQPSTEEIMKFSPDLHFNSQNLPQEDLLKAAIQSLPKPIDNVTPIKIDQINGQCVDNTQRIEVIQRKDEPIRQEKDKILSEQVVTPITSLDVLKIEILVDKNHLKLYKEDFKQFETLAATKQLKHLSETCSAKGFSISFDKLVTDLDQEIISQDYI